ncbi:MAG: hypothetical protein MI924_00210 [Chloroflexales bacterium]|nr:hypothetical protein [Chloroflexales bacterium]
MTSEAIPIYTGQDFYVPSFQVKLQERPLGKDVIYDITQVSYTDNIESVDSFELTVNNWDAEKRAFKYSDTDLFIPGKKVELWMGYYGRDRLRLMIVGKITSLRPTFPASGQSTLAVSGQNLLHSLRGKQVSRRYENLTASQIARQIGQRMRIRVRTDPNAEAREERYTYRLQQNEYDIVFLMKLAEQHGYDLFVEERGQNGQAEQSTLYFGPPVHRKVVYALNYGSSLIDFQPNLSTSDQVGAVQFNDWDSENKRPIRYTAQRDQLTTQPVSPAAGKRDIEESFRDRNEIITHRPVRSQQEGQTLATETHERVARQMLTGSGATVGLPDLRAGGYVQITGVGTRYSGRYFVTSTTHTIGNSGYTTSFEARREHS